MKKPPAEKILQFRQGDVLIERVDSLPPTKPRKTPARERGRAILAYGEVTGHCHEIADPAHVTLEEMAEAVKALGDLPAIAGMEDLALTVRRQTTVTHQEHAPITLPPGKYIVRIQREYSPKEIRRVVD